MAGTSPKGPVISGSALDISVMRLGKFWFLSNLIQMPLCSMQTRILANAELTRFGLTMPPGNAQGAVRSS